MPPSSRPPEAPPPPDGLERLLGSLLRVCVGVAAGVLLAGGVWYLIQHGAESTPDRGTFAPEGKTGLSRLLRRIGTGDSQAWMALGLLLVLLTPLARVFVSACAFLRRRDWAFVGLTLIVLGVLLGGLLLAG